MKKIEIDDALKPEAMDAETWQRLTAVSECYACSIGERLHEEGAVDNRLILALSGLVSMNREIDGKDQRSGLMKRPGEILACASLHINVPKVYSNVVDSDRAIVLITQRTDVLALCESCPAFMHFMFQHLSEQVMRALNYIIVDREMDAEKRVAYRLDVIYAQRGTVALTQSEIANVAGTSRATVSKTLTLLEGEGIISRKYGEILILEADRLKSWATEIAS